MSKKNKKKLSQTTAKLSWFEKRDVEKLDPSSFGVEMREVTAFEMAVEEVRTGAFSILSDKAQDRLISLFTALQREAFERGAKEGSKKGSKKDDKTHSAAGS